jgi:ABC-type transporter Mla subunit MlaD
MKIAVGAFVLIFFVTIAFSSFLILQEKGTFDKRYNFHFITQSANSFSIGMPLKFSGFDIGTIDTIALHDDGEVKITFSVAEKNRKWLNEYCVLLLQKPLIGSPHIEIYTSTANPPLEEDSIVDIIISDDINGMISKLEPAIDKMINIISSINKITSNLSSERSDLFLTIKNIRIFTEKLSNGDGLLTTITGDKQSTQSLINSLHTVAKVMEDVHAITKELQNITTNLHQDIINPSSNTIEELHGILKDVKQKLDVVDATVKSIGTYDNELISIKEQINTGLAKSNQIIDKIDTLLQDETKTEVPLP